MDEESFRGSSLSIVRLSLSLSGVGSFGRWACPEPPGILRGVYREREILRCAQNDTGEGLPQGDRKRRAPSDSSEALRVTVHP